MLKLWPVLTHLVNFQAKNDSFLTFIIINFIVRTLHYAETLTLHFAVLKKPNFKIRII